MHERSLVSVKVERCSTYRLSSALFILPLFYLRDYYQFMRVNARSQKRVSGKSTLSHSYVVSVYPRPKNQSWKAFKPSWHDYIFVRAFSQT